MLAKPGQVNVDRLTPELHAYILILHIGHNPITVRNN